MVIKSLELFDFRNYEAFHSQFAPGINFIHGKNGQGKTNLIESLYIVTHLKSFRTSQIKELSKFSKDASRIRTILTKQNVSHEVTIDLQKNQKRVFLDQKKISYTSEYIKNFFSILFSPDQLTFFKEYPLERRNFIDRVLVLTDWKYFKLIKDFNRIKKQKGSLLRQKKIGELNVWNQLLASIIPEITESREGIVKKINGVLSDIFQELTGRKEKLEFWYKDDFASKADQNEASIFSFLQEKEQMEISKGHLCYGPHKDQFWMTINGKRDKLVFSQGEYRISFLSLQFSLNHLISEKLGFNPIILLDDIFSELDHDVLKRTIDYIYQRNNQVFIASTSIPDELKEKGKCFLIRNGSLESSHY